MTNDILVVAEHLQGEFADVTFELLGKGRELASATGGSLCVVVLGSGLDAAALGAADKILSVDHERLADFNPESYTVALTAVLEHWSLPPLTIVALKTRGSRDLPKIRLVVDFLTRRWAGLS